VQADRHGEGEVVLVLRIAKMLRQLRAILLMGSLRLGLGLAFPPHVAVIWAQVAQERSD
jgi:hypothetical protein